jgi:hypothetical protein
VSGRVAEESLGRRLQFERTSVLVFPLIGRDRFAQPALRGRPWGTQIDRGASQIKRKRRQAPTSKELDQVNKKGIPMAQSAQDIKQQSPGLDPAILESLALRGDISGLKPDQKVRYVNDRCHRLGLDPADIPFLSLRLNGKEVLYASRAATDQLARLHGVRREVISREIIQDCYVVTVRGTLPDGRTEDSIGAVAIGGLKGDAFANAIMKAETKAKRRNTLAILGLGMLDESEIETIPRKALAPAAVEAEAEPDRITSEQRQRLVSLIKELNVYGVDNDVLKAKMMDIAGVDKSADLSRAGAEEVIGVFEAWNAQLIEAAEANQDAAERTAAEPEKVKVPF